MEEFNYFNPKTLDEALSLFNQYGKKAMYIAGGTDVMVMMKKREISPTVLISKTEAMKAASLLVVRK
jgi:CO/xanthine dehydrogenase FAD-binding subunit